jgi:hypothetical protein
MLKHDLGADLTSTLDDGPRAWEFSADTDGADKDGDGYGDGDHPNHLGEFPPQFGSTAAAGLPYSPTDPFRPQVRRLITVEAGENRKLIGQLPLSINHILDVERNAQTPDEQSQPVQFLRYMQRAGLRFRPLTEHPDASEGATVLQLGSVPTYNSATPVVFPPQSPEDREFWARRDRQKLARDIYVLLYTIGGARPDGANIKNYTGTNAPSLDVTSTDPTALYTHEQLRRMAQFAVNLVDAMDTDDVITKFEYDKNLGDGWDLDDDPFTDDGLAPSTDALITANGLYPQDSDTRGVVYGVEAQQLAFSEVLGIRSPLIAGGHGATPYDDATMDRDFMFVELQNLLPTRRPLATSESTTAAKAIWRLARYNRDIATTAPIGPPELPDRAVAFLNNADNVIDGGGRFSVSTTNDPGMASSAFFIDTGDSSTGIVDGTYELVAPNATGVTLPTGLNTAGSADPGYSQPLTDLDLIHNNHNTGTPRFAAVNGNFLDALLEYRGNDAFNLPLDGLDSNNNGLGDFANPSFEDEGFDLVLHRRLNPNLPSLNETDNPWIEVDRIRLTMREFNLAASEPTTAIFDPVLSTGHLTKLYSYARTEPLDDGSRAQSGQSSIPYRYNSIKGGINAPADDMLGINLANTSAPFKLWQAHFDRDFASPGELLNLPVIGPNLLTQRLRRMSYSPFQQVFSNPADHVSPAQPDSQFLCGAAAMLLRPDFPDRAPADTAENARDNRWYRLFQFVEVPSRVHRMLGNYVALEKVPGKLNLNTIRHWEVYAGLIDNPIILDREPNPLNNRFTVDRTLNSASSAVNRDRWFEFLKNRDGVAIASYDPRPGVQQSRNFFLPGTPNAKPFRAHGFRRPGTNNDGGAEQTILRTSEADIAVGQRDLNRNWLEIGDATQHQIPVATNSVHQHQLLSKIMNNTTTVSNTFIVYSTAAYFEAVEDPPNSGFIRVGARIDLEPNAAPATNPGWQQRAVFLIDRSEAFEAYDAGSGDFDWKRLVKARATIE